MIQWFDEALNKRLFNAALHDVWFKYRCIVKMCMTFCNSSVVEFQLSGQKVCGSILARYRFYLQTVLCCNCSIYYLLYFQQLLTIGNPGLPMTFFHWSINVYVALG